MLFDEVTLEDVIAIRTQDAVEEAFEQGAAKKERELVIKMRENGLSVQKIMDVTGLTKEVVEQI